MYKFKIISYYETKNDSKTVQDIHIRHHDGSSSTFHHEKDMNKGTFTAFTKVWLNELPELPKLPMWTELPMWTVWYQVGSN